MFSTFYDRIWCPKKETYSWYVGHTSNLDGIVINHFGWWSLVSFLLDSIFATLYANNFAVLWNLKALPPSNVLIWLVPQFIDHIYARLLYKTETVYLIGPYLHVNPCNRACCINLKCLDTVNSRILCVEHWCFDIIREDKLNSWKRLRLIMLLHTLISNAA